MNRLGCRWVFMCMDIIGVLESKAPTEGSNIEMSAVSFMLSERQNAV
ncbi:MAG: hypothetical protein OSA11_02085 [Candidatus Nanopelagicales bacterium]|nr:hypothetical protein [Candidatus Nanopelagicales bacterium]